MNRKSASRVNSMLPVAGSSVPLRDRGWMAMDRGGGRGTPSTLVVWESMLGMTRLQGVG